MLGQSFLRRMVSMMLDSVPVVVLVTGAIWLIKSKDLEALIVFLSSLSSFRKR